MSTKLLLLSNSTAVGGAYLELWKSTINKFLSENKVSKILFIPFAGVTITWDVYTSKVVEALSNYQVTGIHHEKDMKAAVETAESIIIGGGNTFHLLYKLQENNLLDAISARVKAGVPYIGWSAGSNVATPDIGTTNDMPVIWPKTDVALNLVNFNINPHYNEWKQPGQGGETRQDRLNECILVRKRTIVGLSEGLGIRVTGDSSSQTHVLVKSPPSLRPPGSQIIVKVWKAIEESPKYKISEVSLGDDYSEVALDPYLQ